MAEPAPLETPTRVRYGVIVFAVTVAIITYIDRICLSFAGPAIRRDLGLTSVEFGWAMTAFFWTYALFEIPGGWLGDRLGARKALTRVVALWSVFTVATGWATGLTSLLVIRAIFGAGEAGCFPNVARAFSSWLPAKDRARAQGILWLAARWGGAFTPWLVITLLELMSWRRTFAVFGVVGLVWAALFYRWYRDRPEDHPGVNAAERALLTGRERGQAHGPVPWKRFLRSRTVLLLWGQYIFMNVWWPFYVTSLATYLREERHLDEATVKIYGGVPFFFGGIGCLISGFLSGPIARRTGDLGKTRKLFGAVGCAGAAVCVFIAPHFHESALLCIIALGLASLSGDMLLPSAWATCMDVGGRYAGTLSGSMNMFGNLMAGASSALIGYVLVWTGRNWTIWFSIGAAFYLVATLCWMFVDPSERLDRGEGAAEAQA